MVRILFLVTAGVTEIMSGIKLIISAALLLSTVGNLIGQSRNCGLIKSWCTHTHIPKSHIQKKKNALTQTRQFLPCVEVSLKLFVPQSHRSHLKIHSLLLYLEVNKKKSTTQRKSTKDHTCLCLCLRHGKNIMPASMRPVCLCGIIL